MSVKLLSIDTALKEGAVCLWKDDQLAGFETNANMRDHAGWIQPAITRIMTDSGTDFKELSMISVSAGPGSYTGLRVGVSTAKGICYARNIPLILLNTLDIMADAAIRKTSADIYVPMIDARRMEVFTAAYKPDGTRIMEPRALVLDQFSYRDLPQNGKILHFGDGSNKFHELLIQANTNFAFEKIEANAKDHYQLSLRRFHDRDFADLAYSEPFYLKEFYSTQRN